MRGMGSQSPEERSREHPDCRDRERRVDPGGIGQMAPTPASDAIPPELTAS